jgi:hypothetical protein
VVVAAAAAADDDNDDVADKLLCWGLDKGAPLGSFVVDAATPSVKRMARAASGLSRDDAAVADTASATDPEGENCNGNGEATATAVGERAGDFRCFTSNPLYNACWHEEVAGNIVMSAHLDR